MTRHDRNLGFCEEANTYCSIAETEYKQIRSEVFEEFRDFLFAEQDKYADDILQLSMVNNIVDDFKGYWESK